MSIDLSQGDAPEGSRKVGFRLVAVLMIVAAVFGGTAYAVLADGGPNHNLVNNVAKGPHNGTVTGMYDDRICFVLRDPVTHVSDSHDSCAPNKLVFNLGKQFRRETMVLAKVGDQFSIVGVEVKGVASGVLLDPEMPEVPVPTKTPSVKSTATPEGK